MGIEQSKDQVKEATARLKEVRAELSKLARGSELYRPDDPAPYGSAASELGQKLADAWRGYDGVEHQRKELDHWVLASPTGRLQKLFVYGVARPYSVRKANKLACSFWGSVQALEARVARVRQVLDGLQRVPLEVASRCAGLRQIGDLADPLTESLRSMGLYGADLDLAVSEAQKLGESLRQLPGCYFLDTESDILKQATKESTIRAWQVLEQIEAPLQKHVADLEEWQRQLGDIDRMSKALPAAIAQTDERLKGLPDSVDVSGMAAKLAQAADQARWITEVPSTLAVDRLPHLVASAAGVSTRLQSLRDQADKVSEQLEHLQATLSRASTLSDNIWIRMRDAAGAPAHPIDWGQYQDELGSLAEAQADLEASEHRTPERLAQDVRRADRLKAGLLALSRKVDEACTHRDALLELFELPELDRAPAWLEHATQLYAEAMLYAAENWAARLAVPRLRNDAVGLCQRIQRLVPADASQPLLAAGLGALLQQVQALPMTVRELLLRIEQIGEALAALQGAEQAAREKLEPAYAALARLVDSLKNALPPVDRKITRHQAKLESLERDGSRLLADFGQRRKGPLADKIKRLETWSRDCRDTLRVLQPLFKKAKEQAQATLQGEVDSLQALAPFDLEESMRAATRLLQAQEPTGWGLSLSWGPAQPSQDVGSLADEAHSLLRKRQRLLSARRKLQDEILKPLGRQREAWESKRTRAWEQYENIATLKESVESTWPQLACDVRQAEDLLRRTDADEKRLPRKGRSVVDVQDRLGQITGDYQNAIAVMDRREKEISQGRRQLQDLSDQIERQLENLIAYGKRHSDDEAVVRAVDQRVQRINKDLGRLQGQWRKAPPSFREARRALERARSLASDSL